MQAMILAAGFGTRLRPFSLIRPKPLFPVFNKPLLLLHIEQLRTAGFDRLFVNAWHLSEQIVDCLAGFDFITVLVEPDILGTGGGLRNALPLLAAEPLLVLNADIVHNLDLQGIYHRHLTAGSMASLVVHRQHRFTSLAVDEFNRVHGIGAGRPDSEIFRQLAFTGIHVIEPALLATIPGPGFYDIIDLYRRIIDEGNPPHAIEVTNHYWRDMGTVEDYLGVHEDLVHRPGLLAPLVSCIEPHGCISPRALLHPDTKIVDWAVVGAGVECAENVVLEKTVIWDGVRLPKNTHLSDIVVADSSGLSDCSEA